VNRIFHFWQELKRRNVVRRNTVYAATAFVILELASIIQEPLNLPDWTVTLVIILLSLGLIVSIILSWVYEINPEGGIEKTLSVDKVRIEKSADVSVSWKIATYSSFAIIIFLIVLNVLPERDRSKIPELQVNSIAVLPFENLGSNQTEASLHEALPIALIMEMQNIEGFTVRPRSSTIKYKNTDLRSPEIGNELRVNFLLNGYVQQQGQKIAVDIMLIRAMSEEVVWNASYEMELDDIFKIQRNISKEVVASLKNSFLPKSEQITDNPDAYMAYLTGLNYYWRDESFLEYDMSTKHFQRAIDLDPSFVMAYSKLAAGHCWIYHYHYDRTPERLEKAKDALDKGYLVAPDNMDLKLSEGVYYYVQQDYKTAMQKYNETGGQVMDRVEYLVCVGSLHRRQLELEKTEEYFLVALEEDPQNLVIVKNLTETYFLLRDYKKAESYLDRFISMDNDFGDYHINKIFLYMVWDEGIERSKLALSEMMVYPNHMEYEFLAYHKVTLELMEEKYKDAIATLEFEKDIIMEGQFSYYPKILKLAEIYQMQGKSELAILHFDSARVFLEARLETAPSDSRCRSALGIAYAGLGRNEDAIQEGELAREMMPLERDFYVAIYRMEDLAHIYTMTGENEKAIEALDELLNLPGNVSVNLIKKDPTWKPLWNLPEFQEMLKKHVS
jgi:serine/threonine-protein kinase